MKLKRRGIFAVGAALMLSGVLALAGCASGGSSESADEGAEASAASAKYTPENPDIKIAYLSFCGSNQLFVAEDKGILEEEGLNVEEVVIDDSGLSLIDSGKADIYMNPSTLPPMNQIAQGNDLMILCGNMAQGATPMFTREDGEYNGVEDLKGKSIGYAGVGTEIIILKDLIKQAGMDPEKDVTWQQIGDQMAVFEAVKSGEIDYGFSMTGFETVRADMGLKDVWYPDDDVPMYSCCRVVCRASWLEENQETAKALIRSYVRAGEYFADGDYMVQLLMDRLDQDQAKVEGYVLNPHYVVHADPLKNSVEKDWQMALDQGEFENPNNIEIADYIATDLYKQVIDDLLEENPDSEYYQKLQETFEQYDM